MRCSTALTETLFNSENTDVRLPTWSEIASEPDQLNVLEYPLDRSLFVVGPPGSGKTVLALHRAQMLADRQRRVTLVTYNRMLRRLLDLMKKSTADSDEGGHPDIRTMHDFVWHDYKQRTNGYPPQRQKYIYDWDAMLARLTGGDEGVGELHMVVDEAQDLPCGYFRYGIRLPGAGLIFSSGNRRKWTEPPGKLLHDEVVPAQICRHRGVGLCGCEGVGNEGRLAGRRTCAEHVAVESAHGRLAVPLSPRQLVGASSAATVGPGGSLAGRWVWRLPRRIPVPHGGARPRGSRRWRRRDEDTRRGPTPRTAASCLVAFPPLAAKPTGRGLGRRRDGAD